MPVASCQKCQEFLVPDDDSVIPVHYHPYARFDDANNRSSSEKNTLFSSIRRSKDNNIKKESTNYFSKPTKGLDTVDSATGGLLKLFASLEIINITFTKIVGENSGHLAHKILLFTRIEALVHFRTS